MASVIVFLRGTYRGVNRFIEELSSKYVSFTFNKPDGKGGFLPNTKKKYNICISVRYVPLGAFEIVFPIEHQDLVLTTLFGKRKTLKGGWPWIHKFLLPMRLAMKLKQIPNYKDDKFYPIWKEGVHVIPIGYKKDIINATGNELL